MKKTCRYCKYAEWPRNSRGHRIIANTAGKCNYTLPPLPKCTTTAWNSTEIKKHHITDDQKECPVWEEVV